MSQDIWPPPAQPSSHATWGWLRVLLLGLSLFIVTTIVMFVTGNPNLYPTVILVGNFLVPIVFVTFLYDHQHLSALSPATIAQSFAIGGVLGVLGASVLEPLLIPLPSNPDQGLTLSGALLAGLIEEGCKIVAVAVLARRMRHDVEIDSLLLGAAVGMGSAALQSTGYTFTAFLASRGLVGASIGETVLRAALAPLGHGIWAAILSAILFRQSVPHHFRITGSVVLAYLFVALLHGLWDGLPRVLYLVLPLGIRLSLISLVISVVGIAVLVALWRQALHGQTHEPAAAAQVSSSRGTGSDCSVASWRTYGAVQELLRFSTERVGEALVQHAEICHPAVWDMQRGGRS
jgi:RsiW-degrading membrane proteinase PrsW (M82 family)